MAKKKGEGDGGDGLWDIPPIETKRLTVFIRGKTPLLCNRLSEKTWRQLLMPPPKKNAAERALTLKHDPPAEYRASVYRDQSPDGATRLAHPAGAFRRAIAAIAVDVPGASKAQIGRLVRVVGHNVSIFGVPRISCMIVRQAGPQRTPDVRTRAIVPEWACVLDVEFSSLLKEPVVLNLLSAAGDWIGVGDGRNEKGSSLSCGCWEVVDADDPDWDRIVKAGGREAQDAALENPVAFDHETEDLLAWFEKELRRREGPEAGKGRKAS